MAMYMIPGPMELLMILLMGSGGGLPLGLPPGPEDPVMSHVAPEECLFYLGWTGTAAPDPNSHNQTEQLLAEPEVQQFVTQLEKRIVESITREAGREGPEAAAIVDDVHLVVKTVLTSPTAVFLSKVDLAAGAPDARAGAVVNLGEHAAEVEKSLRMLEAVAFNGRPAEEVKGETTTWRSLPMPREAPPILWAVKGKYLIVGLGRGEADAIYGRARTATPAWLADVRKQLAVKRMANVTCVNVAGVLKLAGPVMGPEGQAVLEALGLANVRSVATVTGLDDTGCVTKTLIGADGPLTGLLSLAAAEPLTKQDLALIPKDSTLAAAARFDLAKAYKQLLEIIGKVDPRAREEFLGGVGEVEEHLGVNLAKDVFESLGDVWRVYNSPSDGGLVVTGLTAVVDVKDHDRLVAANGKLVLGKLAQEAARRLREPGRRRRGAMISQAKHGDQTIFFLNVVGEEFPLAPAWCITDKELVVGLFPQNVKAYLDRKASGGAASSLADVPEVAAVFAEGKAPMKVVYCDEPEIFKLVYPVVQIVAQMACGEMQREGIDLDVSILPSAPAILRHLRPGLLTVRHTEAGILIESHQTLPVGGASALGLPAFLFMGVAMRPPSRKEVFAPSQARSMNNLKQIALAMHNYADAFKTFPPAAAPMKEAQPPVSWRVRILPYLEQQALYDQYHFDEAWDSEHNKQLIARIPDVYVSPGVYRAPSSKVSKVPERGLTHYLAVVGDDFALSPTKKRGFAEIRDGTSNTIMVVEADDSKAVPWTKPEDLTPDKKNPGAGLGHLRTGAFLAAFCDGSVHRISAGLAPATLYALFTRGGGEVADWDRVERAPRRPGVKTEYKVAPAEKVERTPEEKIEEKPEPAPRIERRTSPPRRRVAPLESAP